MKTISIYEQHLGIYRSLIQLTKANKNHYPMKVKVCQRCL